MRNNFDGLRLLGALLVLVSHQFALQGQPEPTWIITLGTAGVAMFFGLSGYLVTGSWINDPHLGRFTARRMLRIYPAFAVCVLILAAAGAVLLRKPEGAVHFLHNLWFDHRDYTFFPPPQQGIDGPLWTIPYEMLCYLGVACTMLVGQKYAKWLAVALFCFAPFLAGEGIPLAACFLAGALLRFFGPRILALVAVGAVLGLPGQGLMLAIASAAVLVGLRSWPVLRDAAAKGDFSYGIYLWHWPIIKVGTNFFPLDSSWLIVGTLFYSFCVAWVSWHYIEEPALRLKPKARQAESLGDRLVPAALPVAP